MIEPDRSEAFEVIPLTGGAYRLSVRGIEPPSPRVGLCRHTDHTTAAAAASCGEARRSVPPHAKIAYLFAK